MDNIIVKYSDFFQDDGGFEKIKSDFKDLGEFLIKEAKRVKSEANIIDVQNIAKLSEYEEHTESLAKAFEMYGKSKENITKIEDDYLKAQKKSSALAEKQAKSLAELELQLSKYKLDLAEVNKLERLGTKTAEEAAAARAELKLQIKETTSAISKQQKEILDSNKLTKNEIKLLEAKAVLQKEQATTINEVRERLSALRIVASQVNITTQEGIEQVSKYNAEIDELTATLSENSDQFIKNKINIGNYEESIITALEKTQFFKDELGFLNVAFEKLLVSLRGNTAATKADTAAKEANVKATTSLGKSIKVLNTIAKASVILLLVAAVASLAAVFSQGRSGAIATGRALQKFAVIAKITIGVLAGVGRGLIGLFGAIFTSFKNGFRNIKLFFLELKESFAGLKDSLPDFSFGKKTKEEIQAEKERKEGLKKLREEIAKLKAEQEVASQETNYKDSWNQITEAIKNAKDQWDNAKKTFDTVDDLVFKTYEYADAIRALEIQITKSQGRIAELELASEDATTSFATQQENLNALLVEKLALLEKEADIAKKNLVLANLKAKIDANANNIQLGANPETNPVGFTKELLNKNITIDERTQTNPLDDTLLQESVDALNAYQEKLNEISLFEKEIAQTRRQLALDLFEQNLDLLIDLIDTEKNLSEQQVNDVTKNFQDRLIEFNRFLAVFKDNAQRELNEFNNLAKNLGVKGIDFKIKYNDDGTFDIFNGNQKLALDNIVELNKQLQATGLPEISINRFREFVVENRNAVKDFKDLNKELTLAGIKVKELFANFKVDEDQNKELDDLNERIRNLRAITPDFLDNATRKKILKELEKLEKEKTEITERADYLRQQNRINAIDDELKTVEKGSEREIELLREKAAIEKEIIDQATQKNIDKTKEQNEKAIAEYEKFISELKNVFEEILDKISEISEKRVQTAEEEVDKQGELVDEQKRRAELGLTNTLAFEQKQLAEREAQLIKQRKRQERLEKIKALWTSYNAYAEKEENPNQAIFKALRDFAILDAIAATFGDGGLVADKVPIDSYGITRGRSHNGRGGGIPVLVEGGEGFFSANEINNLGRDNFYKIKHAASLGPIDSNMFTGQKDMLMNTQPIFVNNDKKIINELREVKQAIESKPTQMVDVPSVVDGVLKFTETIQEKNKTKRNHFKIKKPRL